MTTQTTDNIFSLMMSNAENAYENTDEHKLQQKRISQMQNDCLSMFAIQEREFAEQCCELLTEVQSAKIKFIYHQAFKDCINLLKSIEVI